MTTILLMVIYLIFISLGLPDSLLGSAWPKMQIEFGTKGYLGGVVSMCICFMTIVSSLLTPKLLNKLHTKWIVIISIFLTIIGLLGFSYAKNFKTLLLFTIFYGLGAGAIDSSINNYVSIHFSSRVMNFLHCFYGVGAIISPYIMSVALMHKTYHFGYRWVSFIQMFILVICFLTIPVWFREKDNKKLGKTTVSYKETIKQKGVIITLISFFAYCAAEATCFLWIPTFFKETNQTLSLDKIASFGSLIFLGLTIGRIISGIFAKYFSDLKLIRIGFLTECIALIVITLFTIFVKTSFSYIVVSIGFVVLGCGFGPIYPSIQHLAPINFSKEHSPNVISLQMASAYLGSTFMPFIFGLLYKYTTIKIMPFYLLAFAIINIILIEKACKNKEVKV